MNWLQPPSTRSHFWSNTSLLICRSASASPAVAAPGASETPVRRKPPTRVRSTVVPTNAGTREKRSDIRSFPPGQLLAQQLHPDQDLALLHHVANGADVLVVRAVGQGRHLEQQLLQVVADVLRACQRHLVELLGDEALAAQQL